MMRKNKITLTAFALAICVSTAWADTLLFKDDFSNTSLPGWMMLGPIPGTLRDVNQQLVLSCDFGPADTNNLVANYIAALHAIPISGPLPDNQTLELRADLAGGNQDDTGASVHYLDGVSQGYIFSMTQKSVVLWKFWNGMISNQCCAFFDEHPQITNQNVTLVLALTRLGTSLSIKTDILDKDNGNAVLFERTVTDTSQADPVLPNRSADGWLSYPDPVGTPWPILNASGGIALSLVWVNPTHGQAQAQAVFDNAEVWQYQYPQLSIQTAVVLSWPLTQSQFALESASSLSGPWTLVSNPLWSTNAGLNQVSIVAPDSMKFFRLLHIGP